jgi:hypothetical protein
MDDDDLDHEPWSSEGAHRVLAAAERLTAAIKVHADSVTSATAHSELPAVFAASSALLPAVLEYADAQFDYTGNGFPFGVLHQFADDDSDDSDEHDQDETRPASGVSVLRRHDYRITDEEAVLAAGRAAYLRAWPNDTERDAAVDVTHIGRALYQVAHADSWDSLDRLDGLRRTGGIIRVIDQAELLSAEPDDWPSDLFATYGENVYEQTDVQG